MSFMRFSLKFFIEQTQARMRDKLFFSWNLRDRLFFPSHVWDKLFFFAENERQTIHFEIHPGPPPEH